MALQPPPAQRVENKGIGIAECPSGPVCEVGCRDSRVAQVICGSACAMTPLHWSVPSHNKVPVIVLVACLQRTPCIGAGRVMV